MSQLAGWAAALRRGTREAGQAIAGLIALLGYALTRDDLRCVLSVFAADSPQAHPGRLSAYRLTVANPTERCEWIRLMIDVYRRDNPVHPDGHHAFFEAPLLVRPRRAQELLLRHDWRGSATFVVDGVSLPPARSWLGPARDPGAYLVHAVQLDGRGRPIDRLTLAQRMM